MPMYYKKWIIIPLISCLVLIAVVIFFLMYSKEDIPPRSFRPEKTLVAPHVKTAQAETVTVTEWHDAVGTVQPGSQARIEAQVSGLVSAVLVNAGDKVRAGELIVSLDDRQIQSGLAQARQQLQTAVSRMEQARQAVNGAEAAFEEAQSAYERINHFMEVQAATQQDLEQARSRYLQAKSGMKQAEDVFSESRAGVRMAEEMVSEAKITLSYTQISAPSDGEVLKRLVDPGDTAMPGKPLLLLRTAGGLRLEAHVRESMVGKIYSGLTLPAELPALEQTVDARVSELVPYADARTRTFLVKAELPDVPGLYPGMYGKLRVPYREIDIVLIPEKTIDRVGQLELVMVKTTDGWKRRYIKTGNRYEEKVEVLSGLLGNETLKIREPGNVEYE
jgi:HlyD family secretion protein